MICLIQVTYSQLIKNYVNTPFLIVPESTCLAFLTSIALLLLLQAAAYGECSSTLSGLLPAFELT